MKKLVIFCSVLFMTLSDFTNAQNSCVTPDNKNGVCIRLRECDSLFSILRDNPGSLSSAQRDSLRQSRCPGYQFIPTNPVVCCQQDLSMPVNPIDLSILPKPGDCGTEAVDKIIGGRTATITEYPWMVLIEYTRTRQRKLQKDYKCAGSLINENYVVTAAHCAEGRIAQDGWKATSVRLGEHRIGPNPDCDGRDCADPVLDVGVSEVIVHENYVPFSSTQYNDIALIRLSRSVGFTDFIRPICLPDAQLRNKIYDNGKLEVAGFGLTENGTYSDVKQKLEMPGFNWGQCNNVYQQETRTSLISSQLCAGGERLKDTCNGDSGGPLMAYEQGSIPYTYLVGIISRGPAQCGTEGFPGVYTRVDQYLDWIVEKIR